MFGQSANRNHPTFHARGKQITLQWGVLTAHSYPLPKNHYVAFVTPTFVDGGQWNHFATAVTFKKQGIVRLNPFPCDNSGSERYLMKHLPSGWPHTL
ncbi:hypothetical protein TNCT_371521 [Trichonephila clavata]|uniref:Uncharacterized protein n=1 Tax=Trichonephila clavata TaxID=2740835 RepID=A0A8X6L3C4_TRICU|nr:hypothetical protein TNCT_83101 [Trichonephila clavata]GFR25296.1 hypothetical protein TNCT_371521 [Trichonephila clavata]